MNLNLSWLPAETRAERMNRIFLKISSLGLVMAVTGLSLTGCGSNDVSKFGKEYGKASPYYRGNGTLPKGGGHYKVGSPYVVNGKKYYPSEDRGYDKVGKASWYGPTFHGRKTANGEYFDMNRLTGAHPTLPLPSFVRVTNLKNDKSVIIRINDRGPYAHTRVLDVSKKTAQVLGFQKIGTARVRVQYVGRAPLNGDDYYAASAKKRPTASSVKVAAHAKQPKRVVASNSDNDLYIQAASFSNRSNARRLGESLLDLGPVDIVSSDVGGRTLYRVRVGPLQSNQEARVALRQVVDAGHTGATLVIE